MWWEGEACLLSLSSPWAPSQNKRLPTDNNSLFSRFISSERYSEPHRFRSDLTNATYVILIIVNVKESSAGCPLRDPASEKHSLFHILICLLGFLTKTDWESGWWYTAEYASCLKVMSIFQHQLIQESEITVLIFQHLPPGKVIKPHLWLCPAFPSCLVLALSSASSHPPLRPMMQRHQPQDRMLRGGLLPWALQPYRTGPPRINERGLTACGTPLIGSIVHSTDIYCVCSACLTECWE